MLYVDAKFETFSGLLGFNLINRHWFETCLLFSNKRILKTPKKHWKLWKILILNRFAKIFSNKALHDITIKSIYMHCVLMPNVILLKILCSRWCIYVSLKLSKRQRFFSWRYSKCHLFDPCFDLRRDKVLKSPAHMNQQCNNGETCFCGKKVCFWRTKRSWKHQLYFYISNMNKVMTNRVML